jgi:hypothetical protein
VHTLTTLEFITRLGVGLGCGAELSASPNSTQVAAHVVSGIGFLGGGVILRGIDTTRTDEAHETKLTAHLLLGGDADDAENALLAVSPRQDPRSPVR